MASVLSGLGGAKDERRAALGAGRDRIGPIGLIRPIGRIAAQLRRGRALGEAGGGELFAVTAAFDKALFEGGNLVIEEEVSLVDQADERVGANGGIGVVEPLGVEGVALLIGEGGEIRPIGPIRRIRRIGRIGALDGSAPENRGHAAYGESFGALGCPLRQVALAEEVLVVEEQFLEAGAGDVEQAQLGLG